jgi:hypothetical protein
VHIHTDTQATHTTKLHSYLFIIPPVAAELTGKMALCNVLVATLIANRRRPRARLLMRSSLLLLRCCCSVGGGGGDDSVFFHQLLHRQCICIRRRWSSHTTIINRAPGPLPLLLEKEKGCRVCVRAERVPGETQTMAYSVAPTAAPTGLLLLPPPR